MYMKSSTRNLGIDILRILSMLGVVFLHVLGHGGILYLDHTPVNFSMVWFFEVLTYPAVNCFVLISGYVGYKDNVISPKIKNLLSLMFTVTFYSISIYLVLAYSGIIPFELNAFVKNFFPTMYKNYWFFSAYFGMFLLSPLLNLLVQHLSLKYALAFLSVLLFLGTGPTTYDAFTLTEGYSMIWLVFIYLTGAIIKKFKLNELLSKKWWLIIALTAFLITWISKIAFHYSSITYFNNRSNLLIKYVSPTIIIMAVALLCLFSKIKCNPSLAKIISFFASSTFSVYLIHDNNYIRNHLMSKIHTFIDSYDFIYLTLFIIFMVLAVFVTCILIDKIRIVIFKILKIEKLSVGIEGLIRKAVNTVYLALEKKM